MAESYSTFAQARHATLDARTQPFCACLHRCPPRATDSRRLRTMHLSPPRRRGSEAARARAIESRFAGVQTSRLERGCGQWSRRARSASDRRASAPRRTRLHLAISPIGIWTERFRRMGSSDPGRVPLAAAETASRHLLLTEPAPWFPTTIPSCLTSWRSAAGTTRAHTHDATASNECGRVTIRPARHPVSSNASVRHPASLILACRIGPRCRRQRTVPQSKPSRGRQPHCLVRTLQAAICKPTATTAPNREVRLPLLPRISETRNLSRVEARRR
jgi:hypothetical protein